MDANTLILTGGELTLSDVQQVLDANAEVKIADSSLERIRKSRQFVDQEAKTKLIYGVNTGFGPMASHILGTDQLEELQLNLVRSHAVGMGDPIKPELVLAAMVVRLNTMAKGWSGVSEQLAQRLAMFINRRIIPVVPEHGSVGASGDLVQLAHIALALIGEGEAWYGGKTQSVSAIMQEMAIPPYSLLPKEGLSLINGTSMMSGIGAVVILDAQRLVSMALRTGALANELVNGFDDSMSEQLQAVRPHAGQIAAAKAVRDILAGSKLLRKREEFQNKFQLKDDVHKIPESVQEVYSLRCVPQILGPILDTLSNAEGVITTEINSATDNPIVDWESEKFLHGGNFHGDYVATAMDQLKAGLVKMTMLSERRINFFLNENVNRFLPPFLNMRKPGLTLGLQGLQFVATSTTAYSQTLAGPHTIHSIPTNGDNQDIVSMGTDAALITSKVVDNAYRLLAIELITLTQAVDILKCRDGLAPASATLYNAIRARFPAIVEDRVIIDQLQDVTDYLKHEYKNELLLK